MPWASLALNQEAAPKEAGSPAIAAAHSSKSHKPENLGSAAWKGDNSKKTTLKKQHEHLTCISPRAWMPSCIYTGAYHARPSLPMPCHYITLHSTTLLDSTRHYMTLQHIALNCLYTTMRCMLHYTTLHGLGYIDYILQPMYFLAQYFTKHIIYIYIYIC